MLVDTVSKARSAIKTKTMSISIKCNMHEWLMANYTNTIDKEDVNVG